jgi:hypothetical protein
MNGRRAFVLVCDDALFSLSGKVTLAGVYPGDITISGDELTVAQLIFFFTIETPKEDVFSNIKLRVTLPSLAPVTMEIPMPALPTNIDARRTKYVLKLPFLIQQPQLKPGRIETVVILDDDEIDAGGIWITSVAQANATSS